MKAILDLHTHTIESGHAFSTIKENIEFAVKHGIKYLGISDHAPNMPASPHLYYFQNLRVIPREVDGVKIFRGIEANILDSN
ncbi:MAG: PHP domain-containing protein, partial [Peptostreptococcaceae bacterium]